MGRQAQNPYFDALKPSQRGANLPPEELLEFKGVVADLDGNIHFYFLLNYNSNFSLSS